MARILITSGPTRQYLDPVRYLSNASSGRMGSALARAAVAAGHDVVIVSGPVDVSYPDEAELIRVESTEELLEASLAVFSGCDGLIAAAAPCDYRPAEVAPQKLKKTEKPPRLELERTPDVLSAVAVRWAGTGYPRVVVGFAAETESLLDNASQKLAAKNLDLIVANDVSAAGSGFGVETNQVVLLGRDGEAEELPLQSKAAVADAVLDRVVDLLAEKPVQVSGEKTVAKRRKSSKAKE